MSAIHHLMASMRGGGGGSAPAGNPGNDDFNRTDSTTSMGTASGGNVWTPVVDTWGISSGKAYKASGTGDGKVVIETGLANRKTAVNWTITEGYHSLILRYVDANNYLALQARDNGSPNTQLRIHVFSGGGESNYDTTSDILLMGTTYLIEAELNGSSVNIKVNGSSVLTSTRTEHQTATKMGFRSPVNGDARWDNLVHTVFP